MPHVHLQDRIKALEDAVFEAYAFVLQADMDVERELQPDALIINLVTRLKSVSRSLKQALHHLNVAQDIFEGDEDPFTNISGRWYKQPASANDK